MKSRSKPWLRLRDEGDKVTLTYKKRFGTGEKFKDEGMYEKEIVVSDFEKTADILNAIGMVEKFYEEKNLGPHQKKMGSIYP